MVVAIRKNWIHLREMELEAKGLRNVLKVGKKREKITSHYSQTASASTGWSKPFNLKSKMKSKQ